MAASRNRRHSETASIAEPQHWRVLGRNDHRDANHVFEQQSARPRVKKEEEEGSQLRRPGRRPPGCCSAEQTALSIGQNAPTLFGKRPEHCDAFYAVAACVGMNVTKRM